MHTQHVATTPAAIYWTTQAEETWFDQRNASLSRNAKRKSSKADVEEFAREIGAKCVNLNVIARFFDGEAGE